MSTFPSILDLEVSADYQMSEARRARQQANLPQPPPRIRMAVARALIAVANQPRQAEPDAPMARPAVPAAAK